VTTPKTSSSSSDVHSHYPAAIPADLSPIVNNEVTFEQGITENGSDVSASEDEESVGSNNSSDDEAIPGVEEETKQQEGVARTQWINGGTSFIINLANTPTDKGCIRGRLRLSSRQDFDSGIVGGRGVKTFQNRSRCSFIHNFWNCKEAKAI